MFVRTGEDDDEIDYKETNNTALHVAVRQGNTKSADIILEYMAKIKYDSSRNFRDIFSKLVEQRGFLVYLEALPQQTRTMKRKQILRVADSHDDLIVKMSHSQVKFADERFYREAFQEIQDFSLKEA